MGAHVNNLIYWTGPGVVEQLKSVQTEIRELSLENANIVEVSGDNFWIQKTNYSFLLDRCSCVSQFTHQETNSRQQSHQANQFGCISWTRIDTAGTIVGTQQVDAPIFGNFPHDIFIFQTHRSADRRVDRYARTDNSIAQGK
jgi:hypothetical protein